MRLFLAIFRTCAARRATHPRAARRPRVFWPLRLTSCLALIVGLTLTSCASPVPRADALAESHGWETELIRGADFRHRVFRNRVPRGEVLHVYIEGDGTPYLQRYFVAADPTPRNPLMLRLMALDPAPSVYVGRPCYFDTISDPECDAQYWTLKRFSPRVVESLASAVQKEQLRAGAKRLELFGHSGGGTLAVLLSARLPGVTRVVTLAPTMDTEAWTDFHRYTPLKGSLNPAEGVRLDASIRADHYVGGRDDNVPPVLVRDAAEKIGGNVHVIDEFTHTCCWDRIWPDILRGEQ